MDMIERVARKMCAIDGHPQDIQYEGKPMWASYALEARTVIMTMREPTEAIELAWLGSGGHSADAARDWRAMIDAALAPPQQI
jgi:hypothetical protein